MVTEKTIKRWIKRHTNKHVCACGCGWFIEIKPSHHKRGIPKFIKGHNFSSGFNPRLEEPETLEKGVSPSWEILSESEKERRLSNLKMFPKGEEHPNWKGGRLVDDNGYIRVLCQDHPFSKDGYVLEHRFVMENHLRENFPNCPYLVNVGGVLYLNSESVVHHINEKKQDNRLENLFPFPNAEAHIFWHNSPLTDSQKLHALSLHIYSTKKYLKYINSNKEQ